MYAGPASCVYLDFLPSYKLVSLSTQARCDENFSGLAIYFCSQGTLISGSPVIYRGCLQKSSHADDRTFRKPILYSMQPSRTEVKT